MKGYKMDFVFVKMSVGTCLDAVSGFFGAINAEPNNPHDVTLHLCKHLEYEGKGVLEMYDDPISPTIYRRQETYEPSSVKGIESTILPIQRGTLVSCREGCLYFSHKNSKGKIIETPARLALYQANGEWVFYEGTRGTRGV